MYREILKTIDIIIIIVFNFKSNKLINSKYFKIKKNKFLKVETEKIPETKNKILKIEK